jgi:hypothetical protein
MGKKSRISAFLTPLTGTTISQVYHLVVILIDERNQRVMGKLHGISMSVLLKTKLSSPDNVSEWDCCFSELAL